MLKVNQQTIVKEVALCWRNHSNAKIVFKPNNSGTECRLFLVSDATDPKRGWRTFQTDKDVEANGHHDSAYPMSEIREFAKALLRMCE